MILLYTEKEFSSGKNNVKGKRMFVLSDPLAEIQIKASHYQVAVCLCVSLSLGDYRRSFRDCLSQLVLRLWLSYHASSLY